MKKKKIATALTALSLLGNAVLPASSVIATTEATKMKSEKLEGSQETSLNSKQNSAIENTVSTLEKDSSSLEPVRAESEEVAKFEGDYQVSLIGETLTINSEGAEWENIVKNLTLEQRAAKILVLQGTFAQSKIGEINYANVDNLPNIDLPKVVEVSGTVDHLPTAAFYGMVNLKLSTVKVKTIGEAVFAHTGIEYYDLDEAGITKVPRFLLYEAKDLASVKGDNVISVGNDSLSFTKVLKTVTFPNATAIGANAFKCATGLETAIFPKLVETARSSFLGTTALKTIDMPSLKIVGDSAFEESGLETIDLENLEIVLKFGFSNMASLKEINLPSVKTIGEKAFENTTSLAAVNFPNVTAIGANSFRNATGLETAIFPKLVETARSSFLGTTALKIIDMPSLKIVGDSAFEESGLEILNFENVETVSKYGFYNMTSLKEVNLPSVKTIGAYAFNRSGVENLNLPSLKTIEENAFKDNTTLTTIKADNVTTLQSNAFRNAKSLEIASFSSLVNSGSRTFLETTALKTIDMPSLKIVGESAFEDSGLETIDLKKVELVEFYGFYNMKSLKKVDLPVVKEIKSKSFNGDEHLETISLPSVETIGTGAFLRTSKLKVLNLPKVKTLQGTFLNAGDKKVVLFDRTNQATFDAQLKNVKETLGIGLAPNEKIILDETGTTTLQGASLINPTVSDFALTVAWTKNGATTNVKKPDYVISNGGPQDVGAYQSSVTVKEGTNLLVDNQKAGIQNLVESIALKAIKVDTVQNLPSGEMH